MCLLPWIFLICECMCGFSITQIAVPQRLNNFHQAKRSTSLTLHHGPSVSQTCQMQVLAKSIWWIQWTFHFYTLHEKLKRGKLTSIPGRRNKSTGSFACITATREIFKIHNNLKPKREKCVCLLVYITIA